MSAPDGIDVKRYDRQIRLWGLETQKGLVGARVLMLGANGLANEIAKNLVLAGVGHVHIQDPDAISRDDLDAGGIFSINESQLGMSKAEAMKAHLKDMNPSVDLAATQKAARDLPLSELQSYSFIIGTRGVDAVREISNCTSLLEKGVLADKGQEQSALDSTEPPAKRQCNGTGSAPGAPSKSKSNGTYEVLPMRSSSPPLPKFLACGTYGLDGFCFLDLNAQSASIPPMTNDGGDADNDKGGGGSSSAADAKKAPTIEHALYPTVASAAKVEWEALTPRVPNLYYGLQLLMKARAAKEAPPSTEDLVSSMIKLRDEALEGAGTNKAHAAAQITDEYLEAFATASEVELAPVCAIVGGVIASEVIKVISGKERPLNNTFIFEGNPDMNGYVMRIGPSFDCPWGVDNGVFKEEKARQPKKAVAAAPVQEAISFDLDDD